uniref:NADH-ubiquinone oxidoreductase chain 2 n=1 Tax=Phallus indusiatus TaxID=146777 RepID=A0A7D5J876_9AGAM|nr:NADH dehydrogenase subunit 2 [Dictyophora indusiata]QLD96620.1 NADH dehydrogenase subunit 2 [Dictyophora indusiata]
MMLVSILIYILAMSLSKENQLSPIFLTRIASLVLIYAGVLTLNALYVQSIGSGIGIYCGLFQITNTTLIIESFFYIIASIILLGWGLIYKVKNNINLENLNIFFSFKDKSNNKENINYINTISISKESRDYSLIALFSILGSSFLISSADLLSMYLSLELQSFGLYILASTYRESSNATSAGLKYFLLGGLSSCLILLGVSLLYSITGLTSFDSIYNLLSVFSSSSLSILDIENTDRKIEIFYLSESFYQGLSLSLILIVVGFLFKIAAAPFHNWSPDVYDESPTNVTTWLTIMPKIAILFFLLEVYGNISISLDSSVTNLILDEWNLNFKSLSELVSYSLFNFNPSLILKNLILLSSALSLIIGTVVGLAQTKIKRLMAYSTISHIGFLLLALALRTEQATESFIFYLIQYTITNLNTFFILLAFGFVINSIIKSNYINSDLRYITELKGQFTSNPILSLSLAICLFSMAGIPPLIGFFGKQSVLLSAIGNGYYFMAILAIIVSVISASYYLKIIKDIQTKNLSQMTVLDQIEEESKNLENSEHTSNISNISINIINSKEKNENLLINLKRKDREYSYIKLSNSHSFIISSLTLIILFFVLKPSILLNSAMLCTLNYFYL